MHDEDTFFSTKAVVRNDVAKRVRIVEPCIMIFYQSSIISFCFSVGRFRTLGKIKRCQQVELQCHILRLQEVRLDDYLVLALSKVKNLKLYLFPVDKTEHLPFLNGNLGNISNTSQCFKKKWGALFLFKD